MKPKDPYTTYASIKALRNLSLKPSQKQVEEMLNSFLQFCHNIAELNMCDRKASTERAIKALEKLSLSPLVVKNLIPYRDRYALALEACFLTIMQYFDSSEGTSLWKYVPKYTPRTFALLVREMITTDDVEDIPDTIGVVYDLDPDDEISVPRNPVEYTEAVREIGLTNVASLLTPHATRLSVRYILLPFLEHLSKAENDSHQGLDSTS